MIYQDRTDAGQRLAQALSLYKNKDNVRVLGLARGGVPVAREVASGINAPLDLLVVRKLGLPNHKELAMGAIAPDACWLNREIVESYHVDRAEIDQVRQQEQEELERRERVYRQNLPPLDLRDRIVILVDDGLATGATLRVAALSVRQHQPQRIIAAVPVAAPPICDREVLAVDEVVCLQTPERFYAVGFWYENFTQVNDAQVQQSLQSARDRQPTTTG
ncbi:MAG: phosphoribosyltransferase [Spirulinaceae cyanobacterium]